MFWIVFGAIILILGIFGPLGLIIAGLIVWYIAANDGSKDEIKNVNNITNNIEQYSTNQNSILSIEKVSHVIDIVCTYALKYEKNWTSQKVRYVKDVFSDFCLTSEDERFLRERLKVQYRRPLSSLVQLWLNQQPNLEEKLVISDIIIILMVNTCYDFELAKEESIKFGKMIGLSDYDCYTRFFNIAQKYGRYNNQSETEFNNNQKAKHELSAEILGISLPTTREVIQKAYRKKIHEYHPDKNVNVTPSVRAMLEEQTHRINEARDYLLEYYK